MKKIYKIYFIFTLVCLIIQPVKAKSLNCNYTYRNGSTGENVKILQSMLNEKENCNLTVDGIFGSKTKECVKKYQKNNYLAVDGIVGKMTCGSLNQPTSEQENNINKLYIVKTGVNFRQGPSTNYNTYGILPQGTEVLVLEYTNSNWYKVSYEPPVLLKSIYDLFIA